MRRANAARRCCIALVALTFAVLLPAVAPAGPGRTLTPEDQVRFRRVTEPRVSPDGAWVAYTVRTEDLKADIRQTDLWMTSWDGATTQRLTFTRKESENTPRWSPDGRYLAFLSSRGDDNDADQLWLLPRAGGEAERVTELKCGVDEYEWSPDGARIAVVMADSDSVAVGKDDTQPPIVIDRFYFKNDDDGYLTHKRRHVYAFDLATREVEPLTRGDWDDLHPAWSPDGSSIAFVSKRGADADRTSNWDVFVIEARPGATPRQLTRLDGVMNNPDADHGIAWSPDGSRIAFLQGGPPKQIYYVPLRLAVVPAVGGPVRPLTATLDREITDFAWAPDSRSLYGIVEDDCTRHLLRVPAEGGAPAIVAGGARVVSEFDVNPAGRVAALIGGPETPFEVFALDGAGERRLSHQNDSLLAELRLGETKPVQYRSGDGTEIHGFVLTPPGYEAGKRYPVVMRLHGGPTSQHEYEFDSEWQILAAQGYVILAPNVRGSSGRGREFSSAIFADWGNKDAKDAIAMVDWAIARGIADPKRLGVGGWSYGGILTNYVIASDTRFKAATSGAGASNILAGFGTDEYIREYLAEVGPPWAAPATAAYLRMSYPFLHADRIKTPTLFLCGEKDFNVPLLNSEQMYAALKTQGVDTQLVIYPGQHHGPAKPSYRVDEMRRYVDWYARHLK